tara:strand:- start:157 stop:531 length:375 start_codon:yes stop_codon:yes gene_type:complete
MRKITDKAIRAFANEEPFKLSNTEVKVRHEEPLIPKEYIPFTVITELLLHSNMIAKMVKQHINGEYQTTISMTSAGWKTATTKERLNGLLHYLNAGSIQQNDFTWYYNGEYWNGDTITVWPIEP